MWLRVRKRKDKIKGRKGDNSTSIWLDKIAVGCYLNKIKNNPQVTF